MSPAASGTADDPRTALLQLYDTALPQVYGYLLRRCGRREVAEELTSETFLAAAAAVGQARPPRVDMPWLVGVARHKLVDHWRRREREDRNLRAVATDPGAEDPWDARLDALRAEQTLGALAPQHRLVLTLRYVDDLPVTEVARLVDRSVHATEGLLVRARRAFRLQYEATNGEGDGYA
ncbi:MAG: polymerase sigma-70 factor, subfamily [Acidimicrobiaceae bacterium]|nr:polymerase sigma-70 factor, subfamily [Acidimicrobiaceae bacterium]